MFAPRYSVASTGIVRPLPRVPLWASTEYLAPVAPVGGFLHSPARLPRYCEGKHKNSCAGGLARPARRDFGGTPSSIDRGGPQSHGTAAIGWLRHHAISILLHHTIQNQAASNAAADTQVMSNRRSSSDIFTPP